MPKTKTQDENTADQLLEEFTGDAEQATENAKTAKAKAPKASGGSKPAVNRLEQVIESQKSPTMWQYARIAKAVVARTEAGQQLQDALNEVLSQAYTIVQGIIEQQPASSKDGDIDAATKQFFASYAPKSTSRQRGGSESGSEQPSEQQG